MGLRQADSGADAWNSPWPRARHAEDAIKKVSVSSNDLAKREDEFDIVEGDTHHSACSVFYEALNWFEAFLRDDNIFPEEPFVGPG